MPERSVEMDQPAVPLDADDAADRRRWRLCFWLCFLLTPAVTMLTGAGIPVLIRLLPGNGNRLAQMFGVYAVLGMFALGTLGAAYCLLRLRNGELDWGDFVARLVVYSAALVFAYIGILFVGCGTIAALLR